MADHNAAAGGQGAAGTQSGNGGAPAPGQGSGTGTYSVPAAGAAGAPAAGQGRNGGQQDEAREDFATAHVSKLIRRYGTAQNALDVLAGELFDMREERRLAPPPPPPGSVVLVGADVEAWTAWKGLNLPAKDVQEKLTRLSTLETAQAREQLGTQAQQAAQPLGYNHEVLSDLLASKGLQLDLRDTVVVQADRTEKTVKMGYVRPKDQPNAAYQRLDEYAQQHLKPYLPALTARPQGGTGGAGTGGSPAGTQGAPAGGAGGAAGGNGAAAPAGGAQGAHAGVVVYEGQQIPAGAGAAGGALDPVAAMIAANHAAAAGGNPLRPAAPAQGAPK